MDHLIKSTNERLVLDIILENNKVTKKDIANTTGLSFPTISRIIDQMTQQKQIHIVGQSAPANGRKAYLYQLNPSYASILSIYFQYDIFTISLANIANESLCKQEVTLHSDGYVETIYQIIDTLLATHKNIKIISLGIPGGVKNGQIKYIHHYDELLDVNIKEMIVKKYHIPCNVERDVNAIMYGLKAKYHYTKEDIISLLFLTKDGPGSTSLVRGHVLRGQNAFAGEVGFLPLYDETNLQEVMTKNSLQKEELNAVAKLLASLCTFINPQELIVIENQKDIFNQQEIITKVTKLIPEFVIPNIKLLDDFYEIYQLGLLELGKKELFRK